LDPRFKWLNGFNNNEDKVRIWDALLAEMSLRGSTTMTEEEETDDNPGGNQDPYLVPHADGDDLAFFIDQITDANANGNMAQQEHTRAGGICEQCEVELAAYRGQLPSLLILNEKRSTMIL
jgi:hypothetical protein